MVARAPRAARRVAAVWRALATPEPGGGPTAPVVSGSLPAPAHRWVARAVAPGRASCGTAVLAMHGRIRIGDWRAFTARQVIAAGRGYVWAATARFGPVPVLGYDRYSGGTGEMRWRLAGLVPVMSADGRDVTRSAAGRLAGEIVLTPGAALGPGVRWEALDHDRAVAHVTVAGTEHPVTIEVDDGGVLRSVRLPRWGDPAGDGYGLHEFVVRCAGEREHDGVRLPARYVAAWQVHGRETPFFEAEIDTATFP